MTVVYLTTGTSWTVPSDWSSTNTIECIGGGGAAATGQYGVSYPTGGGGGGYSKITNLSAAAMGGLGATVTVQVGAAGVVSGSANTDGTAGGDTWFNGASLAASSVGAKGGGGGVHGLPGHGGAGGAASSGIGTTKYSGGHGAPTTTTNGGGGGGGAAGPNGNGADGAPTTAVAGGGGGSGGGSAGNGTTGAGGNNFAGTGGGAGGPSTGVPGAAGTSGGGGGGGFTDSAAGNGGAGIEWDASHGAGGAGGGGGIGTMGNDNQGGAGGLYGGGGGSAGQGILSGAGAQGIIVITYTPIVFPLSLGSVASTVGVGSGTTIAATISTIATSGVLVACIVLNESTAVGATHGVSSSSLGSWGPARVDITNSLDAVLVLCEFTKAFSSQLTSEVVTFTLGGGPTIGFGDLVVFEIEGPLASSYFDTHAGLPVTLTTDPSDPLSISTTAANTFILGCFRNATQAAPTAGSGWTVIYDGSTAGEYICVEYKIVSTAQSGLSVTETTGAGDTNGGFADAFISGLTAVFSDSGGGFDLSLMARSGSERRRIIWS